MKTYQQLVQACLPAVKELMPWDLETRQAANPYLLILDVREPYEFAAMHIQNSISVPRGVLESACEWDYEETVPKLVQAREQEVVVVCRSGHRSVLAAFQMQDMGYQNITSLKTGLRGWNDYEQPLVNGEGAAITFDAADVYFTSKVRPEQLRPRT